MKATANLNNCAKHLPWNTPSTGTVEVDYIHSSIYQSKQVSPKQIKDEIDSPGPKRIAPPMHGLRAMTATDSYIKGRPKGFTNLTVK